MEQRTFAQLDDNNVVTDLIVVDNANCLDQDGIYSEQVAQEFLCSTVRPGNYLEYRDDGTLRRFGAQIGGTYLPDLDEYRPYRASETFVWHDDLNDWFPADWVRPTDQEMAEMSETQP